jgi:hypothetical protein
LLANKTDESGAGKFPIDGEEIIVAHKFFNLILQRCLGQPNGKFLRVGTLLTVAFIYANIKDSTSGGFSL